MWTYLHTAYSLPLASVHRLRRLLTTCHSLCDTCHILHIAGCSKLTRSCLPFNATHQILLPRSYSPDPTHQILLPRSYSPDPTPQILLTRSYSPDPTHQILLPRSYSPDPTHQILLRHLLLTTHYSLITAHCSLLTAHYSLLIVHSSHCSILSAHYLLLATRRPRLLTCYMYTSPTC